MHASLLTALTSSPVRAGECLVLQARDGTVAGFTTLSSAREVDLSAEPGAPADPVNCAGGMVLSALTLVCGLDSSFCEVSGPLGPVLTRAEVEGGKWKDASAWLVRVSPAVATHYAPLLHGHARDVRSEGPRFVLEIRNPADLLNAEQGEEMDGFCKAKLGDAECGFDLVPVAATVTAVTDAMRLTVSYSGTFEDDHFKLGSVTFTSGALDGVESENLFAFTSGGASVGSIELFEPLTQVPEVGDTLELRIGCGKTRDECMRIQGTALTFRGCPDAPGTEKLLQYPNPGGGS